MKKRFVYSNTPLPETEMENIIKAALMTAGCGKISIRLVDSALEREIASDTAIFTVGETSYMLRIVNTFENMLAKDNCPAIYVLESEETVWRQEWQKNKQRIENAGISLLCIKEVPVPKQQEKNDINKNEDNKQRYASYRHKKNLDQGANRYITAVQEEDSKKSAASDIERKKTNKVYIKTMIMTVFSVCCSFFLHSRKVFPLPVFNERIDYVISLAILGFTWCLFHIAFMVLIEWIVMAMNSAIDRVRCADWEGNVAKISEVIACIILIPIVVLGVYFCI